MTKFSISGDSGMKPHKEVDHYITLAIANPQISSNFSETKKFYLSEKSCLVR